MTAFYIDWSDLQVRLVRPDGFTYGTNAGAARNIGVEFAGRWTVTDRLDLASNVTYLDAKLSEDVLVSTIPLRDGQRLPGASRWQFANTATYHAGGPNDLTFTVTHRYLSDAPATLQQPQYRVNDFHQFDARMTAHLGDSVKLSVFGNNLGDKRGKTFSYGDFGRGEQDFIIRPRTFGVTLAWAH